MLVFAINFHPVSICTVAEVMAMTDTQHGTVAVNGAEIYYEAAGQVQPLVLIHAGIADNRMWDEQIATFARQYRGGLHAQLSPVGPCSDPRPTTVLAKPDEWRWADAELIPAVTHMINMEVPQQFNDLVVNFLIE